MCCERQKGRKGRLAAVVEVARACARQSKRARGLLGHIEQISLDLLGSPNVDIRIGNKRPAAKTSGQGTRERLG